MPERRYSEEEIREAMNRHLPKEWFSGGILSMRGAIDAVIQALPPRSPAEPGDVIQKHVREASRKEAAALEGMCKAFMGETGLPAERCMIVRRNTPTGFEWWCQERSEEIEPPTCGVHTIGPDPAEEAPPVTEEPEG